MANTAVEKVQPSEATILPQAGNSDRKKPIGTIDEFSRRSSNELVIGLCGPIGAGLHNIRLNLETLLRDNFGYETQHIHISEIMKNRFPEKLTLPNNNDRFSRYVTHQNCGDALRSEYGNPILAEAAIMEMTLFKQQSKDNPNDKFNKKIAYIIDQLKHPAEVELLRLVYQHNFYLVGVIRTESERKRNLRDEGINPKDIDDLIHRDRKSEVKNGQQTEKALLEADYFIRNNQSHVGELKNKINRLLELIHGYNGVSPSLHEKGMFSAFSASLQSACLSRQVGAAIMDSCGNLIATGRNDVPKFNGGLYSHEDSSHDYRCIHRGAKCYNDMYKFKIKNKIEAITTKKIEAILKDEDDENKKQILEKLLSSDFSKKLTDDIYKESPINSLIEYSRAIHAEMDAITTLARMANATTIGKTIYTTTYPCHNCARHIVAAGINRVVYIEPYEKSLALDLHDDAICDFNSNSHNKVVFEPFEGVSPKRYSKFFLACADRKNEYGIANKIVTKYGEHVDIQSLYDYQSQEDFVVKLFNKKINPDAPK
jgi:Deoxycytidylate deaminase